MTRKQRKKDGICAHGIKTGQHQDQAGLEIMRGGSSKKVVGQNGNTIAMIRKDHPGDNGKLFITNGKIPGTYPSYNFNKFSQNCKELEALLHDFQEIGSKIEHLLPGRYIELPIAWDDNSNKDLSH